MTTATPLEDALVGALRVLDDLARRRLTADDARRDLAALGRRHDLGLRLISDEEPFDGSVHYDVLVRGAGQPTVSLSLAAGEGFLRWRRGRSVALGGQCRRRRPADAPVSSHDRSPRRGRGE